ncbi:MAG: sigma-70 family RNA polymerase sigma factor [Planctomycetota bacterium]
MPSTARPQEPRPTDAVSAEEIEYVPCDSFHDPDAGDEILACLPGTEADWDPDAEDASDLLTAEQERHLFRKMNFLKFRAERLRQALVEGAAPAGAEDRMSAKLRDALAIRDELILRNRRLAVFIAKRFLDRQTVLDDLAAAAQPTLIRAVDLFDYSRGFRFSTYAAWSLRNFFVRSMKRRRRAWPSGSSEGPGVLSSVVDLRADPDAECRHCDEVSRRVHHGVGDLPERLKLVVTRRYGLDGGTPRRFREIGEELGVSTERARQIFAQALGRMRGHTSLQGLTGSDLCFRDPLGS